MTQLQHYETVANPTSQKIQLKKIYLKFFALIFLEFVGFFAFWFVVFWLFLLILRGLGAAIPYYALIGGRSWWNCWLKTTNLLKLKIIACMKAEN